MTPGAPGDAVGPWAKEKLAALEAYLDFYTKVLKNQKWCRGTIYVDAFAGPGLSPIRATDKSTKSSGLLSADLLEDADAVEYLKGSPRRALDIPNPFSRYIFIDQDDKRVAELRSLQAEYGKVRSITVQKGDANELLLRLVQGDTDWNAYRAVVFLDPYGMQLRWDVLEKLSQTRAIEVIVNFPLGMAIQRLFTRSGEIPLSWQAALDKYFGSGAWRDLVYEDKPDLFGLTKRKIPGSAERVLAWYRDRLRALFGYVSEARLITNTKGHPLYYLVWAGPHKKGLQGADYILKMASKF